MKRIVLRSKRLQVYYCLQGRMNFSQDDKLTLYREKQGYEGEKRLAKLLQKNLANDYIALYGLLLENQGTVFQIDCLLIFQQQLVMIEVKNFIGEYEFRENQLYSINKNKYFKHPLQQLQRSDSNLRELLSSKLKVNLPLTSYVGYVNQEFTLFTEKTPTIILPTQLTTFIKKLNNHSRKLNSNHQNLARKIESLHIDESPFIRLPEYSYSAIRKGVLCRDCRSKMSGNWRNLICTNCSKVESTDSGVLRSVIEFHTLFPDTRITTPAILKWCEINISNKSMRNILRTYLKYHYRNNVSYFSFK